MNDFAKLMAQDLGRRVRQSLINLNAIKEDATLFVWPREERVVCLVDPLGIHNINTLLSERSRHQIQTACQGRRVVFTNHRGAFIQVAYQPEPYVELKTLPVDWAQQSSPLHVPIGMTKKGPLWLSLPEMDSVLIGGARRMGKTRLIHSWIRALQRGGECKLFLWDGKNGLEFGRYQIEDNVAIAIDLKEALRPILDEVQRREAIFKSLGVSSLKEHNLRSKAPMPFLVLIIDEAAFIPKEAEAIIVDLVARCGAFGVHPVIATQRPDAEIMNGLLRANLSTRIALPVSSPGDSRVVLNQGGADKLPKQPGRLLMIWNAKLVEAQAFQVEMDPAIPLVTEVPTAVTQLDADERRLVEVAAKQCDGFFKIKDLTEITGLGREFVLDLAKRWELMDWLTAIQTNAKGHRIGRQVTPKLLEMAGIQAQQKNDFGELGNLEN